MQLNLTENDFPYRSQRMPVLAPHGVVATSSPLAAQAGMRMLLKGGSAIDAAVATAITLTVVEPWVNGIGSDAFALVWDGGKVNGLNGSGRAPASHTPEMFDKLGLQAVPGLGWLPVTIPGAPAVWRDLHERYGKLPFADLFEPAIDYAEDGFPLAPETAYNWAGSQRNYQETLKGPEHAGWWSTFMPEGRVAKAGDTWRLPDHAKTLARIAETKSEAFYKGDLAEKIAAFAAQTNGYITCEDMAAHRSTWVDPISVAYRDHEVWEIPPNGQGIAALQALAILEGYDMASMPRESVQSYHLQIEAMKLAFSDAHRYVADPDKASVPIAGLLDKTYAASRRALIGEKALMPAHGEPPKGGTVYLTAADADGMMVSYIQSNYQGFGSGVVIPGTGISLQNRGRGFSLEPGHPNQVAPGKRPFHTIIPGFLTRGGEAVGPFGVMGGAMQPQGHTQMILNQVDWGMNPQASLDAPRWQSMGGKQVLLEKEVPAEVVRGLIERGHEVNIARNGPTVNAGFGRGQIIRKLADGGYIVGSEPRADGCAVGY
jgi:gamma-glutamyltranspeptidase/glutathione hydrolase